MPVITDALITKGTSLTDTPRFREGIALLRGAHALAVANGLTATELRAVNNLAIGLYIDTPHEAVGIVGSGLELARRIGDRGWLVQLGRLYADLCFGTGDWDAALTMMADLEQGLVPDEIAIHSAQLRAEIAASRGDPAEAERLLDSVDGMLQRITNPFTLANHLSARSIVALADGRLVPGFDLAIEAASVAREKLQSGARQAGFIAICARDLARLRQAIGLFDEIGPHGATGRAEGLTLAAGVEALDGRKDAALTTYRRALEAWRDLRLPWDEATCAIGMVTLLDASEPEVRAAAESAREILTRLRATPFLERLEVALADGASTAATARAEAGETVDAGTAAPS